MKAFSLVASLSLLYRAVRGKVVSSDAQLRGVSGRMRYYYDDSVENGCESVMILGVGTAMSINDYDIVSSEIVTDKSIVNIIIDQSPRWFVKTNSRAFANLANEIADKITDIVPACKSSPSKGFIVGGHSAGGQAALGALTRLKFEPVGFFGLDPFRINPNRDELSIPAMFWGFSETTCQVTVNQAAKGGYQASEEENRVFYQVQNPSGSGMSHCVFTDSGCFGAVCPANSSGDWVRSSVGESARLFIEAISSGNFDPATFDLSVENVRAYVNEEVVDPKQRLLRGIGQAIMLVTDPNN